MKTSSIWSGRSASAPWILLIALMSLTGCQRAKSANPLSPQVAGPMEGVSITTPVLAEPSAGVKVKATEQPVTLVLVNSVSNIARPLTLTVQLGPDRSFTDGTFGQSGLVPSGDGVTRLRLPVLPTGRTYYWRAKSDDGANTSGWSNASEFEVLQPIILGAPDPRSPVANERVSSNTPEFTVGNGSTSGPHGSLSYHFQIADNSGFDSVYTNADIPPGNGETRYTMPPLPGWDRVFYWRVRITEAHTIGPWSRVEQFRSPMPPVFTPPPGFGPGPVPTGDWQSCGSLAGDKDALVRCVHSAIQPGGSAERAFEVTKRVAWLLRGEGVGLLIKNGGENTIAWMGYSFSLSRVCYPNGHIFKVLSDAGEGGTNGPGWSDNDFVHPSLYVPAINPGG